jgi:hypothetical protein
MRPKLHLPSSELGSGVFNKLSKCFLMLCSGVVFLRKKSSRPLFVEQCYVPGALMWWNGKHAMARFWSGIVVVIRENKKRPRSLNNDPCKDGEGRDGGRGTIDSYRLSHHGK